MYFQLFDSFHYFLRDEIGSILTNKLIVKENNKSKIVFKSKTGDWDILLDKEVEFKVKDLSLT